MRLTILHTNDIHGHLWAWKGWEGPLQGKTIGGLAALSGAINAIRSQVPNCLLLDAGDLIGDTMLADLTQGKALIQALNFLKYDAWTLGNHEPDFGIDQLLQRMGEANFPTLACNVTQHLENQLLARPYVIKQVDDLRVGVLGVAYPKTPKTTAAENIRGVRFERPDTLVANYVSQLKDQSVSIVILLSHLGLAADQELASKVNGIDVIVGGHSHNRIQEPAVVNRTLIVQAGAHGSDLGRLDLLLKDNKIVGHERTLVLLDNARVPPDASAQQFLHELTQPHQAVVGEIIGAAGDWLIRAQTLAGNEVRLRDAESPVDSLFADLIRQATKSEFCFLPGVGYGVAIPPGPIRASQLRQLVPHDGKIITMQLPGAHIIAILEQAVDNVFSSDSEAKVGGMIQVSGLRFTYDPDRPQGHRVIAIERTEGSWDAALDYTVATNSMLANGGHNQCSFLLGQNRVELSTQYQMLKAAFQQLSAVMPPSLGRISQIESQ
jgi:5'-nucleotidase / UDP-sugar diphosphatase